MKNNQYRAKGKAVKEIPLPDLQEPFSAVQLGLTIKHQRTKLNLRIIDVAEKCGLSKDTVNKIEKGELNVRLHNVMKVINLLGITLSLQTDSSNVSKESDDEWF
ncbi:hypothetical protein A6E01_19530 (plasmid) [Vibrio breoganii]|uniref:HTH cro/C1-type domain-containing protein n=1 Tax=Vibrio breoganii TaxID=553239 RepID=A0AAN1CU57_9VIBR|nr:helix-turn-helix domain-containing protein [Vibrio breoganii]ANO35406.1 hypothetical protein A6E01_19530 [Vibrio breoganii]